MFTWRFSNSQICLLCIPIPQEVQALNYTLFIISQFLWVLNLGTGELGPLLQVFHWLHSRCGMELGLYLIIQLGTKQLLSSFMCLLVRCIYSSGVLLRVPSLSWWLDRGYVLLLFILTSCFNMPSCFSKISKTESYFFLNIDVTIHHLGHVPLVRSEPPGPVSTQGERYSQKAMNAKSQNTGFVWEDYHHYY